MNFVRSLILIAVSLVIPVVRKAKELHTNYGEYMISLYVLCVLDALDILTSIISNYVPGLVESNPFARTSEGHFYLAHGLPIKAFHTFLLIAFGFGIYRACSKLRSPFPGLIASIPLWISSYGILLDAVFGNVLWMSGFYTNITKLKF